MTGLRHGLERIHADLQQSAGGSVAARSDGRLDATLNGNLAEQLQEPTLMAPMKARASPCFRRVCASPPIQSVRADTFPAGTTLLYGTPFANPLNNNMGDANARCHISGTNTTNPFPSNFQCNPSRIDGLAVTNSSQGGGGIFVHGWAHNLEISNNRVYNNQGTLAGGITVGQGEHPDGYLAGTVNADPGSCRSDGGLPTNAQLPFCFNLKVNVHHNAVTNNASEGDELFSATPAARAAWPSVRAMTITSSTTTGSAAI